MKIVLFLAVFTTLALSHRTLPEYEINLDLPIDQRYAQIVRDFKDQAIETIDFVFQHKLKYLKGTLRVLAKLRGKELPEMQEEINFFAKVIGVSPTDIQILNWLYEISTILVPHQIKNNLSWMEDLELFGYPMCTGILAYDENGQVIHGRNLDFSMADYLSQLLYVGRFTRGGKELFKGQMIVGFSGVITGFKSGVVSIEVNTRFSQVLGQNVNTLSNLILKANPLGLWVIRKTLETSNTFEQAVNELSTHKVTAPIYLTMSGVGKGVIIAREPESVAHQLTLGVDNPRYIVITNFDYWNNDWREWFDPTANFYRRRIGVMKSLDSVKTITKEVLFETLNRKDVIAKDTIFQGIFNVQTGFFQATSPYKA